MNKEFDESVKNLIDTIKTAQDKGTDAYDTQAEVKRIDGQTAWVHIPGGVDETPIQMTINANIGDLVQVRVAGGTAWITGNLSAPPTDNKFAEQVKEDAETAILRSKAAHDSSELAIAILQGKTTNFIQRSNPPKINRVKGDLWIYPWEIGDYRTNTLNYWDGTQWKELNRLNALTLNLEYTNPNGRAHKMSLTPYGLYFQKYDNATSEFTHDLAELKYQENMLLDEYKSQGYAQLTLYNELSDDKLVLTGHGDIFGINFYPQRIYLPNGRYIYGSNTSGEDIRMMGISSGNNLLIGVADSQNYAGTYIYAGTGVVQLTTSIGSVVLNPNNNEGYNLFRPSNNGTTYLGGSSYRWKSVYTNDVHLGGTSLNTTLSKKLERSYFKVTSHSFTQSQDPNTDSGTITKNIDAGETGYIPYGIVGVFASGTNLMYQNIYYWYLSDRTAANATVTFRFRNNANATYSGSINFRVLWIKE